MTTSELHVRPPLNLGALARGRWQHAAGLAGWALFGAGWGRVVAEGVPAPSALRDGLLVTALFAVIVAATLAWVRWNLALQARKGPRRLVTPARGLPTVDHLGRRLLASSGLREAGEIIVCFDDSEKWYRA